jgi:hypothetical protein
MINWKYQIATFFYVLILSTFWAFVEYLLPASWWRFVAVGDGFFLCIIVNRKKFSRKSYV